MKGGWNEKLEEEGKPNVKGLWDVKGAKVQQAFMLFTKYDGRDKREGLRGYRKKKTAEGTLVSSQMNQYGSYFKLLAGDLFYLR